VSASDIFIIQQKVMAAVKEYDHLFKLLIIGDSG